VIKPHGAESLRPLFVESAEQRAELFEQAKNLPQMLVSSATAANAVMLAGGYFTPLTGFMNKADALSVARSMTLDDGLFFPVPVMNLLPDDTGFEVGQRIALLDPNVDGQPVIAVQTIESIERFSEQELVEITQAVYGTTDLWFARST